MSNDKSNYDDFLDLSDDFADFDPFNTADDEENTAPQEDSKEETEADLSEEIDAENDEEGDDLSDEDTFDTDLEDAQAQKKPVQAASATQTVKFPVKPNNTAKPVSTKIIAESDDKITDEIDNPMAQAADAAETETAQKTAVSLFSTPPVFSYGSVTEDITEDLTFEELHIDKSVDFPELDDPKKIEWSIEYGKIVKKVVKPCEINIAKMKAEIELSKEFLDALKKSKDNIPSCKVKPRIIAQTKGIKAMPAYKGVFSSQEEAEKSDKLIRLFPASNGIVFEQRVTEMGVFTTPAKKIPELTDVSAGLVPALPLIPFSKLMEIIAFFRSFMTDDFELEAMVHIFWYKELKQYQIVVPQQYVSKARIISAMPIEDALNEKRYIHYADIHSHNSMSAEFSMVDDEDERATRLYIVIGKLNRFFPEINCRISNGGTFWHIKSNEVLEGISDEFPWQWTKYVHTEPQPNYAAFEEVMYNAL